MANELPIALGEVLDGKYRVDRVLGRGGMGVVVAATHLKLAQAVALKFITGDVLGKPDLVERFLREARSAVRLKSQHVARVYDVAALPGGAPYIVMEFLEGQDLATLLHDGGPLPIATAARFVLQACDAIAEAHSLGIIHRDLKPSNLFVTRTRSGASLVKVLDFGLSKVVEPDSPTVTASGAVMGSPSYMSPEQMRDASRVDLRTDIWSLGVILYQLVTGRLPFTGQSLLDLCAEVSREPPKPLGLDAPELEAVILRCLEKDPDRRFSSIADLAGALAPLAAPENAPILANIVKVEAAPRARRTAEAAAPALPVDSTVSASSIRPARRFLLVAAASGGAAILVLVLVLSEPVKVAATVTDAPLPPPVVAAVLPPDAPPRGAATVELEVASAPAGAEVFLDGARLGEAPGPFAVVPGATPRHLELRKAGYLPWAGEVTIARSVVVPVRLAKKPKPPSRPAPDEIDKPDWGRR